MNKLIAILLLGSLAGNGYLVWQLQQQQRQQDDLQQQLMRMEEHATTLEQQLLKAEEDNLALREHTVEGMLNKTNQTLLEQWDQISEHFSQELERLGEELEEQWGRNEHKNEQHNEPDPI